MTLGNAATAHVRLIVWCKACQHKVEPIWQSKASGTAPRCRFLMGGTDSSAPRAGAGTSTWW
jgi:hypothetical protein